MSDIGPEGRSFEEITTGDLRRLAAAALQDHDAFFRSYPKWARLYRGRLIAVVLCQGAASHFLDGKQGINDFDVYSFFADHPARRWYAQRLKHCDFGDPKFGTTLGKSNYLGRRIDLMGRGIRHRSGDDPAASIRRWLQQARTKSARCVASAPVVLVNPDGRLGEVIWTPCGKVGP